MTCKRPYTSEQERGEGALHGGERGRGQFTGHLGLRLLVKEREERREDTTKRFCFHSSSHSLLISYQWLLLFCIDILDFSIMGIPFMILLRPHIPSLACSYIQCAYTFIHQHSILVKQAAFYSTSCPTRRLSCPIMYFHNYSYEDTPRRLCFWTRPFVEMVWRSLLPGKHVCVLLSWLYMCIIIVSIGSEEIQRQNM